MESLYLVNGIINDIRLEIELNIAVDVHLVNLGCECFKIKFDGDDSVLNTQTQSQGDLVL